MNILGYLLLALIAVGFVLCLAAMGISTVKAFQKKGKDKDKNKNKEKEKEKDKEKEKEKEKEKVKLINLQDAIKNKVNSIGSERKLFEVEEQRIKANYKTVNMNYSNKKMIFP